MKKSMKYLIPTLILSFLVLLGIAVTNCGNIYFSGIKGNGKVVTENRTVADFNKVEASGAFNILLTEGAENLIKVEADENIIKHIKTEVKGNILKLYTDTSINNPKKLNLFINYKSLISIDSDGACKITGNSEIKAESFTINLSGATDLKLNLSVVVLNSTLSGAGSIEISGNADKQNIELSGASSFDAYNFITNITTIDLSGVGSAKVNAVKEINGSLSGVGSIHYKGDPIKNITISGLGSVSKKNN